MPKSHELAQLMVKHVKRRNVRLAYVCFVPLCALCFLLHSTLVGHVAMHQAP